MAYRVGSEVAIYSPSEDAGSGSTLPDLVGSNDGTITNGTREADTDSGGTTALELSSGHVVVPNSGDFAFGTDPFWYSVWFKLTSTASSQMILDKGFDTGNTTRFFFLLRDSTTWRFYSGGTMLPTDVAASGYLNNWVNVIFQRDGGTVAGWINGSQVFTSSAISPAAVFTNTDNLSIGSRSDQTTSFMAGRVDEVRLGTGVLTSGQIAKLSSQRVPSVALSSVMHGHFEAGIQ